MEQIRKEFRPIQNKFINANGRLLSLQHPIVMGIVNITPDSFYAKSRAESILDIKKIIEKMLNDGAGIIDLGGQSTRPGSTEISSEEEARRIQGVVSSIIQDFPDITISIDTYRTEIAKIAISEGACIVNDISGGDFDDAMFDYIAGNKIPYIIMHTGGKPQNMQNNPQFENVVNEVFGSLIKKAMLLQSKGAVDILLDPGFGFGKTIEHNFDLLRQLNLLSNFGFPILVGLSRKSMITKTLHISSTDALNGTSALHMIALQNGASILRVHDVKEAVECVKLWQQIH
jgi:dihydropteroate synthase